MLIVEVKEGESIERALRRYKRKYRDSKMIREMRKRRQYTKPSVQRRKEIQKAVYREKIKRELGES